MKLGTKSLSMRKTPYTEKQYRKIAQQASLQSAKIKARFESLKPNHNDLKKVYNDYDGLPSVLKSKNNGHKNRRRFRKQALIALGIIGVVSVIAFKDNIADILVSENCEKPKPVQMDLVKGCRPFE